jgi:tRNA-2-methylthio-N6-dimethylallyladenosine synthase
VRGPEWSRPAARVIEEVRALVAGGVREVTLLGQSVMSYGRRNGVWDPDVISPTGYREPFPMLLEAVDGIRGLARLRFTSGHPSGCTEELARAMRDLTSVCEHIHLPLQSGSDRILQRMGREYTADAYRAAVARLKAAVPDLTVTTDIIVGFPSETLAEFEMTRQFMEEIGFDNAFIFKYSSRPETPAAEWEDDVPWDEKQRRNRVLLEDQDRRALAANRALIGGDVEILVEGRSRREPSRWSGRTRADKIAAFEPDAGLKPGDLRKVRVERATAQTLFGRLI